MCDLNGQTRRATDNTNLAQWGLTSFIETLCFYCKFVLVVNLVFPNPPLRQAWERYWLCHGDSANIKRQCKYEQTRNFGQAVWLYFAKPKEKQPNRTSQRFGCFTFTFAPTHPYSAILFYYTPITNLRP